RLFHQRLLELQQGAELTGGGLPHGGGAGEITVLLQEGYAKPGLARDAAARGLELAREQAEQCAFPRAVPPDDAPAVAGFDVERDIGEQRRGAKVHAHAAERQWRHATK